MITKNTQFLLALAATLSLAGCGDHLPGDATGAKVLRNILEKNGVAAKIVSFKKNANQGGGEIFWIFFWRRRRRRKFFWGDEEFL